MAQYRLRLIGSVLPALLAELPAVMLVGPRATRKTTTATRRGLAEPVLLDEWQAAPEVLSAVKRAVDAGSRPGRCLQTGSVGADLEAAS